jgi:Cellulase (glycosyl hydrolase family 5)
VPVGSALPREWLRAGVGQRLTAWLASASALLALAGSAVAQDPFDIAPLSAGQRIGPEYFGIHVHNLVLRGRVQDPPQPTPFPTGQAGALRLWDSVTRWAEVQPERDRWALDRLDHYLDTATANGAQVILTLGSTPRWASARPDEPCSYGFGCAAEPADLADWDRYVETLARRYRGRIAWYEVWNEPHPGERFEGHRGFYTGDLATLLALAQRARVALARVDPAARLLTPGFTNRLPLLDRYLGAGGAALADGLAYHLYARSDQHLVAQVRSLRSIMARHGVAHWPLLNTESSYDRWAPWEQRPPSVPVRDGDTAAALHVRAMILGAFLGVEGWYLHGWDNETSGAVDRDLRPTALMAPYLAVRGWLLGLRPMGCRSLDTGLVRCDGKKQGRRLVLLWRPPPDDTPRGWTPAAGEAVERIEGVDGQRRVALAGEAPPVVVGPMPVAVWLRAGAP